MLDVVERAVTSSSVLIQPSRSKELIGLPKVERKIPLGGQLNFPGWKARVVKNLAFGARSTWSSILALPLSVRVGQIA